MIFRTTLAAAILLAGTGCGMKTNINDTGDGASNRSQACPVRNIVGQAYVQSTIPIRNPDGTWDPDSGKTTVRMVFSTLSPTDGSIQITQVMYAACATDEGLIKGHTVSATASIPQGGMNCQPAAIATSSPRCAN